jgi:Magnesium chelatase, subunit ChlI
LACPVSAPSDSTLAHRGVLPLDELPAFPRSVLEALGQPLEDGVVAVACVGGHGLFPARFQLVGTPIVCIRRPVRPDPRSDGRPNARLDKFVAISARSPAFPNCGK